jgi:hypothetical protein
VLRGKLKVEIECTPEEARAFMGLPDVQPMQEALMKECEARLRAGMKAMDPEAMLNSWLPASIQGVEQMQKMFWSQVQQTWTGVAGMTGGMAELAVRKRGGEN